ncbi:MAG: methyltransferase [Nitrospirota bacterium]
MGIQEEAKELRKFWGGFWAPRVILTANNYRVFDHLGTPKTADQVAKAIKADKRATGIMLDALVGLGLLKKTAKTYKNTPLATRFLVKDSPYYQGDIIRHADALWQKWSDLDAIVKTGKPSARGRDHTSFIKGMHNIAVFKAPPVIDAIGLKGVKKAMDLGGGPGTYAIELAKRGIDVTIFDLPETINVAKEMVKKSGLKNISFIKGNIFSDSINGTYDLILMSQLLHAFSVEESLIALRRCKEALTPGGRVVIHEFFIDTTMTAPLPAALFSVNMLVNTPAGRCYPPAEMKQWLKQLGFKEIKETMLEDTVLVSGKKPR